MKIIIFLAYLLKQIQSTKSSVVLSFHANFRPFLLFLLFFLLLNKLVSSSNNSDLEMVSSDSLSTWFDPSSSSAIFPIFWGCKSSDSDLRAKIIRPFVNFERFYLIHYADESLYDFA